MNILFFGDVVGNRGIASISSYLPVLKERFGARFCIVNGENAASHGFGLRYGDYRMLRDSGADCVTLGNHYNDRRYVERFIEDTHALVRPCNVREFDLGQGSIVFDVDGVKIRVTNVLGTAFLKEEVYSPMAVLTDILHEEKADIHIVDYHAESSSEKSIFGYLFDGKVSAVLGTHTHIQTNDARILSKGTAFMTDVGMCGNYDSVIGYDPTSVINRIVYNGPVGFHIAEEGRLMINAILLDIDETTGLTRKVKPLFYVDGEERIYG